MRNSFIVILLCGGILAANAQSNGDVVSRILQQIEENNLTLKAARQEQVAEVADVKAENNLSDPSVEYIRQYSKHTSDQEDELVVTQEFDFPTAYIARGNYGRLVSDAAQLRYATERRQILLEAKLLCIELIGLNREAELIKMLSHNMDSLAHFSAKRLEKGDGTALDDNRIQLNKMALRTELADNAAAHRAALQRLLTMNGNLYLPELNADAYPETPVLPDYATLRDEILPMYAELRLSEAELAAARKMVTVEKSGWLPKLAVGYRRNTAPGEELNGFIVGASLPLFENRHKVKAARARSVSAELHREELRLQADAQLQALYQETCEVKEAMAVYDLPLIDRSFNILSNSLQSGEISWEEYYEELETLVRHKISYFQLENRYQKLLAEIYADKL